MKGRVRVFRVRPLCLLLFAAGLALAGILVPACGGGGGGGGGGAPTTFVVSSTTPIAGAMGQARTVVVYVAFNRQANAATVTNTNFTLAAGMTAVPATVSYNTGNFMAQLVASSPLSASTLYTVNLSSGIQDAGGIALTPLTFTFTTSASSDTTRPAAPTGLSMTASTLNSITLSWTAATDTDDASASLAYQVFVSGTSGSYDFASPQTTTAAGTATATVGGFFSNTTYFFVVRAVDPAGNVDQNTTEGSGKTLASWSTDVWGAIISPICQSCHTTGIGASQVPGMLMTNASTLYSEWVNVNAVCSSLPAGTKRVVPSSPSTSFVYQKISMTTPPCGVRMPYGGPYLSTSQIQTFFDWINEGAPNN